MVPPITVLYEPEHELFHVGVAFGSRRSFVETVPKEQIAEWLAHFYTSAEWNHYNRLAEEEQRLRYKETLTTDSLNALPGLDLGIDL